jgi:hypothetical protein
MKRIYDDERMLEAGFIGGTLSKDFGNAREPQIAKKIFEELHLPAGKMLGLKQEHTDTIISITTEEELAEYKAQEEHIADAWLIGLNNTGAMILTADCVPLFLWDEEGKYIGLAHCGWRGIVKKLPQKLARLMKEKNKEAKLLAYIGPHIEKCCFEVKEDVASQFSQECLIKKDGKFFVDLTKEIVLQLMQEGVDPLKIKRGCHCTCTCCNELDFFSYRRTKQKDSLMSFIYKIDR